MCLLHDAKVPARGRMDGKIIGQSCLVMPRLGVFTSDKIQEGWYVTLPLEAEDLTQGYQADLELLLLLRRKLVRINAGQLCLHNNQDRIMISS